MKRSILMLTIAGILLISACQGGGGSGAENRDQTGRETVSLEESPPPAAGNPEISLTTEGETVVTDKNGIVLARTEGMKLYSGSRVVTTDSGYAWFGLGEDSLKLDRLSAAEVNQTGGNVVLLETGRMFFDIASAGQRLTIRTAPAGATVTEEASGYVEADGGSCTRLCVFSGSLVFGGYEPVTGTKKSVMVGAGQTAVCELFPDGSDRVAITISDLENKDVAVFAAEEVAGSESLKERIDSEAKALSASSIVEGLGERRQKEETILASRVENAGSRQANWEKEDTGASDEMFWSTALAAAKRGTAAGYGDVIPVILPDPTGQTDQGGSGSGIQDGGSAGVSADRPVIVVPMAYKDCVIETSKAVDTGEYGEDVGDVTVAASVGEGWVTLKGIHIHGNLLIRGGGSHSVKVDGCTLEGTIIVDKSGGEPVHLELLGGTSAPVLTVTEKNCGTVTVKVEDGSSLETVNAEAAVDIEIPPEAAKPEVTRAVKDGKMPMVRINKDPVLTTRPDGKSHTFDKGKKTWPTCTKMGYTTYTCTGCDICTAASEPFSYIADPVPMKNHNYRIQKVPRTDTEAGYTLYECSVCHHTYIDETSYTDFTVNNRP